MSIADLSSVLKIFGGSSPGDEDQNKLYKEVLLMTLARASSSDANINPVEIESIQGIMKRETGQDLTDADIRKASRSELYESVNLRKYLRSVQGKLKAGDKSRIVRSLADVIKSDTEISVLEIDYFNRVADALRVTPAELAGLKR
ncbi:MAG: TerB family tellurite resistance protein [Woeseia sp.]